jgi:molybdopterin-guanine dinucleotide biosynthesis protein A
MVKFNFLIMEIENMTDAEIIKEAVVLMTFNKGGVEELMALYPPHLHEDIRKTLRSAERCEGCAG